MLSRHNVHSTRPTMRFFSVFFEWLRSVGRLLAVVARRLAAWIHARWPRWKVPILLGLFVLVYFAPRLIVFVNAGQAAVEFRRFAGGTRIDRVYGEGVYFIPPWDSMSVYDVRIQEREHTAELLTANGLKLTFQLSIRFRPSGDNSLALLHQQVGPKYVETIVIPEVVSSLRTHVGTFTAEEVYTTKRAILDLVFNQAIENLAERYVTLDRVIIRSIQLPDAVERAVEAKIEQRHIAESYEYRIRQAQQEAVRKQVEAEGIRAYNETVADSLTDEILKLRGIEATKELATSANAKVIVVGNGDSGLPVILGADK